MFQLSKQEVVCLRSQIVISNGDKMGLRKAPYVFTEHGVSMLSGVLKSDFAVNVSIKKKNLLILIGFYLYPIFITYCI